VVSSCATFAVALDAIALMLHGMQRAKKADQLLAEVEACAPRPPVEDEAAQCDRVGSTTK